MLNLKAKYKNWIHFLTSLKEVIKNGYPARKLTVIGVTGTDGKTTTSHLIYEMLKSQGYNAALVSTVGAYVADEVVDTGFHVTTPDATLLQPLIKRIVERGAKYLVMETTSHGLDQHRVLGCNYWAGVLTNVTHEHLDYHGTFENYLKAKAKLFKRVKVAVLNKDDKSFSYFKSRVGNRTQVVSYSLRRKASFKAGRVTLEKGQMRFLLRERGRSYSVKTSLLGSYNVSNILAATAVARKCGVSLVNILKVLKNFKGVPGRMEIIDRGQNFAVIVDFAHTPNALERVLKTLRMLTKGRLIVVFGCAGERDVGKRPMMGGIAARLADVSIFTAEDPRHEKLENIIDEMAVGARRAGGKEISTSKMSVGKGKHLFTRIEDRGEAIGFAIRSLAKEGDTVIICGKGHEKSLAFGSKEIPWSDQKAAKEALKRWK